MKHLIFCAIFLSACSVEAEDPRIEDTSSTQDVEETERDLISANDSQGIDDFDTEDQREARAEYAAAHVRLSEAAAAESP